MRTTFINTVIEASRKRDDIQILSGDSGLGVFDKFKDEFPDRFTNMGVAEQNTISFAAGLALTGTKVFVYNIIPFLLYRCYEQVRNDICYQGLPVVLVGIGSGVTYAPMGMSHYSVEDLGLIQTLPNLVVISPIDPAEAQAAAKYALHSDRPVYIRLAKSGEKKFNDCSEINITSPQVIRDGADCAVVFHGSISNAVLFAYDTLNQAGKPPLLISVPTIQPLDVNKLLSLLSGVSHVVCVEEHYVNCGLGSLIARMRGEHSAGWRLTLLGVPPRFIHEIGRTEYLRNVFGISATDIVGAVNGNDGGRR
jgi:transketolase